MQTNIKLTMCTCTMQTNIKQATHLYNANIKQAVHLYNADKH